MSRERHESSARSRSPRRRSDKYDRRQRSPERSGHHHRHHHGRHHKSRKDDDRSTRKPRSPARAVDPPLPIVLPFMARSLSKHDREAYTPILASYLDIQKQKNIYDMSDEEVRGRWKSFLHKWNRKELAEGWYDPETKQKADQSWAQDNADWERENQKSAARTAERDAARGDGSTAGSSDEEDEYGPRAPPPGTRSHRGVGPSLPTFADLTDRNEEAAAARVADRQVERGALRAEKNARLDDILPSRAEPGTKERQQEKRREASDAARAFRDARGAGGDVPEVRDSELMGAGGVAEARELRARDERKKTERELRREENLLARRAEREERMAGAREKEARTMDMLRRLAQERFGAGGRDDAD